jgi:hypothetical protein
MNAPILQFMAARERYLQLERARTRPRTPEERELFHIELMRAWLEVHYCAQVVTGLRFAEGMQFAKAN